METFSMLLAICAGNSPLTSKVTGQILLEGMNKIFSIMCISLIFDNIDDSHYPKETFNWRKL